MKIGDTIRLTEDLPGWGLVAGGRPLSKGEEGVITQLHKRARGEWPRSWVVKFKDYEAYIFEDEMEVVTQ
jgi:hypothetical protein